MSIKECHVCKMPSEFSKQDFNLVFKCKRCTNYIFPEGDIPRIENNLWPIVSSYIREHQNPNKPFQLTQDVVDSIRKIPYPPVDEKIHKLMAWLKKQTDHPGKLIEIDTRDNAINSNIELMAICYAKDNVEVDYFLNHLTETGFIKKGSPGPTNSVRYFITVTGFNWLESQTRKINTDLCFCAMSFNDNHNYIYNDFIQPAANKAGYRIMRVDEHPHNDGIVDKILSLIRQSKFVICDLTGNKDGVYYEAGFAKGLEKNVIFTCENDHFKKIHFDIRHLNLLKWDKNNLDEAIEKLQWRIEGTIGRGFFQTD